ncbi:M23 family metallopeptidase [Streptomyces sp. NPDC002564]|uniref:M23 family metallopeptidase n=1 Tax=Streptomyces sp. NPDC002564 TaxID=3364649 RepID=UPI0036AF6499
MNDRHPSGSSTPQPSAPGADYAHYAAYDQQGAQHGGYGYDTYATGGYDTGGYDTGSFATDPLFGDMPDGRSTPGQHNTGQHTTVQHNTGQHATVQHDTGQWATTGVQQALAHDSAYDAYAAQYYAATYDTGSYDVWSTGGYQQLADIPSQPGPDSTGQWDTAAWNQDAQTGQWDTQTFDTGAYDATAWNSAGDTPGAPGPHGTPQPADAHELSAPYEIDADSGAAYDGTDPEPAAASPGAAPRASRGKGGPAGGGRSKARRRSPAKRSALLTVAVPSACVMGVAGVAAASVGNFGGDDDKEATTASAPDATSVKPSAANNKLDTQLANLSADAGDFADRASRTQERIDLHAEKVAAEKKAAAEAARKERLRPKFALPVKQHGLSAYYGQAGVNWMSAHSGIDFPVSYGTEVLAATDGTVSTKWNSAYGNMAIVTAKDGTETWYCHLSTHKISSGPVKAGQAIAFSGNSGNSTGPHLHFEVHPGGGSAIDPLPWLRSHGLDPT